MLKFSLPAMVRSQTRILADSIRKANTDSDPTHLSMKEAASLPVQFRDNYRAYAKQNGTIHGEIDPYGFLADYTRGLSEAAAKTQEKVVGGEGLFPYREINELPKEYRTEAMQFMMGNL